MVDTAGDGHDGVLDVVRRREALDEGEQRVDGSRLAGCGGDSQVEDRAGGVEDHGPHVRAAEIDGQRVAHRRSASDDGVVPAAGGTAQRRRLGGTPGVGLVGDSDVVVGEHGVHDPPGVSLLQDISCRHSC